ncbi:hypothetical protein M426DRAFT_263206 [Hypoxylon sp. CI-4A]|nr:hypothetical protein M426DRAFT_263206 [Hypoxylon sp. CI-4A]
MMTGSRSLDTSLPGASDVPTWLVERHAAIQKITSGVNDIQRGMEDQAAKLGYNEQESAVREKASKLRDAENQLAAACDEAEQLEGDLRNYLKVYSDRVEANSQFTTERIESMEDAVLAPMLEILLEVAGSLEPLRRLGADRRAELLNQETSVVAERLNRVCKELDSTKEMMQVIATQSQAFMSQQAPLAQQAPLTKEFNEIINKLQSLQLDKEKSEKNCKSLAQQVTNLQDKLSIETSARTQSEALAGRHASRILGLDDDLWRLNGLLNSASKKAKKAEEQGRDEVRKTEDAWQRCLSDKQSELDKAKTALELKDKLGHQAESAEEENSREIQKLREELAEWKKHHSEREEELTSLKGSYDTLTKDYKARCAIEIVQQRATSQLEERYELLLVQNDSLRQDYDRTCRTRDQNQDEFNILYDDLKARETTFKSEKVGLSATIFQLEERIQNLEVEHATSLGKLQKENDDLQDEVKRERDDKIRADQEDQNSKASLEKDKENLQAELGRAGEAMIQKDGEYEALDQRRRMARTECNLFKERLRVEKEASKCLRSKCLEYEAIIEYDRHEAEEEHRKIKAELKQRNEAADLVQDRAEGLEEAAFLTRLKLVYFFAAESQVSVADDEGWDQFVESQIESDVIPPISDVAARVRPSPWLISQMWLPAGHELDMFGPETSDVSVLTARLYANVRTQNRSNLSICLIGALTERLTIVSHTRNLPLVLLAETAISTQPNEHGVMTDLFALALQQLVSLLKTRWGLGIADDLNFRLENYLHSSLYRHIYMTMGTSNAIIKSKCREYGHVFDAEQIAVLTAALPRGWVAVVYLDARRLQLVHTSRLELFSSDHGVIYAPDGLDSIFIQISSFETLQAWMSLMG